LHGRRFLSAARFVSAAAKRPHGLEDLLPRCKVQLVIEVESRPTTKAAASIMAAPNKGDII
jgi:hypothetical protein